MGFFDKFRRKQSDSQNPENNSFRASENFDENEGLPSINQRKGRNKIITIIGFAFLVTVALAIMTISPSKSKENKNTVASEEKIGNHLPPLIVPTAPPPIEDKQIQVPAIKTTQDPQKPIPLQGQQSPRSPSGKPMLDWTDRKLSGSLLIGGQSVKATVTTQNYDDGSTSSQKTSLGTRLETTKTKGTKASILPNRKYLIAKGTTLDCALETAMDSTLPGITTCRLTRDIYSDDGTVLLLDRGSQLTGEYQGNIKQGQVRVFVLWDRAKTPNGVVINLASPGTDALGRSGLEGWVDNHFMERFGAAILLSFIRDTIQVVANDNSGSGTYVYGSVGDGSQKVVEKILDSTVNIPPTVVINQGAHIQVMVARDLDFSGVYNLRSIQNE